MKMWTRQRMLVSKKSRGRMSREKVRRERQREREDLGCMIEGFG